MRLLLAAFLLPATAWAQEQSDASKADVPSVATEIVIEDLTVSVKRVRVGVALSPDQIAGITKAIEGAASRPERAAGSSEDKE